MHFIHVSCLVTSNKCNILALHIECVLIHLHTHTHTHRRYSASHTQHNSYSYSYTHSTEFGSYRFIGVDACPSPGPRRPFNFFGVLHDVRANYGTCIQVDTACRAQRENRICIFLVYENSKLCCLGINDFCGPMCIILVATRIPPSSYLEREL